MPNLQLHQLRVAAVGKMIAEHLDIPVNVRDVILAGLFHDMGNIVKFDLKRYPESLEPEGLAHWDKVKSDFMQKYGDNSHSASSAIARMIGLPENVVDIIEHLSVAELEKITKSDLYELKIVEYADDRISPRGVASIQDRFNDMSERYQNRYENPEKAKAVYAQYIQLAQMNEQQIFSHTLLKPEDISDQTIAPIVEKLQDYWVSEG
jgi:HD-GYP domain-containing protein (c-di-GMP phosphodiesterase class II)